MIDLMWLFTVPVLKVAIKCGVGLSTVFLIIQVIRWSFQARARNPFSDDDRKSRREYIRDQRKRDAILKQNFNIQKVPQELDAIVIGSGIGGLTTAAILAKSGRRVLVLEQHDQAGGCCHTFVDKGYEFDVGIHYIGKMGHQSLNKTLIDQISEGQIEWSPLNDVYDIVKIGTGKEMRTYPVCKNEEKWKASLKEAFPKEKEAIDRFFALVHKASGTVRSNWIILKFLPLWLVKILVNTGILNLLCPLWSGEFQKTTLQIVKDLTNDKDLQTVFTYCWGDYGTPPNRSHFLIQALLNSHFYGGGFYPNGGASEIALNIIPVIEKAGGKVFVRANVTAILHNGSKVTGVRVEKGSETLEINAPIVISNAGLYNTFQRLLPSSVAKNSYYNKIATEMKPACAAMSVFIGLDASSEDLNLTRENIWAFATNAAGESFDDYCGLDIKTAMDTDPPLLFCSFPSVKDPLWKDHPGRENKSTCTLVTMSSWKWFSQWSDEPLKKRGDEYEEVKKAIGDRLVQRAIELYPQIANHIDYVEIGSPATNKTYLAQPHGEIYGLDHTMQRFDPLMLAKLRSETDIPGLYLTGQDAFVSGFTGALFGGLLAAGAILERNVLRDLMTLHKRIKKSKVKGD